MAELVSGAKLAEVLGVSRVAVNKAYKAGILTAAGFNKRGPLFDIPCAKKKWAERAERNKLLSRHSEGKNKGGRPSKKVKEDRDQESAAPTSENAFDGAKNLSPAQKILHAEFVKKSWDAEFSRLRVLEKQGTLVAIERVRQDGEELGSMLLGALIALPNRFAQLFASISDPHEIHELMEQEMNQLIINIRKKCGFDKEIEPESNSTSEGDTE